jgi:hypothetical protein
MSTSDEGRQGRGSAAEVAFQQAHQDQVVSLAVAAKRFAVPALLDKADLFVDAPGGYVLGDDPQRDQCRARRCSG